ncbi:site-2 protease family protein [Tepidimicrobium xylanilyticum]|uniref:Zn-dependent protease (Includes SpoIVFB) n=1 Tax=Tepidimicrobium xylanilyticum TaxID=1123352 RepID=A0A1H3CV10_9FIRM|nr:site-2 protease family protein [Tepidimicrobium xylanilyticum]GMG97740.1 peptidase M50 [Tepidimicrobium xylanilyticum]SDX57738.1 Zn-dependent protease (includes SpoIVFB) [Tepidimicrobium xylanilyticum]
MQDIILRFPGLLLAIIVHEFSHGYMAYLLGDNTAKNSGRLSLNPLKHLDVVGLIFMLIFRFGWAKPVPINPIYFKNRKRDTLLVSLAGPLSNFILAIIIGIILSKNIVTSYLMQNILLIALWYNIMLGVFNLLPFPPLDGSKILASLLPDKYEYLFYKNERYLYIVLILLIITDTIDKILSPLIYISMNLLIKIIT